MKRREAIKRTAAVMGGALFAPTLAGLLQGCTPRGDSEWEPTHFREDQASWIRVLSETILPETDTPGALATGVPEWMERMVFEVYSESNRDRFLEGLDDLDNQMNEMYDRSIDQLESEERLEAVKELNREMVKGENSRPSSGTYRLIKELTLLGYYTSESGATEELRYEAVPGRYEGCIPYDEIGATWAT
ncbi:MAG: gluconate 2-dehydrogenase subunit 3 family protein [Bacteroidota bacterium]